MTVMIVEILLLTLEIMDGVIHEYWHIIFLVVGGSGGGGRGDGGGGVGGRQQPGK